MSPAELYLATDDRPCEKQVFKNGTRSLCRSKSIVLAWQPGPRQTGLYIGLCANHMIDDVEKYLVELGEVQAV